MKERGFTILEVLLASAVALIIGTFLAVILVSNSGFFYKQKAIVSEGLGLNDTLAEIDNNIKQAVAVAASYPSVSPIFTTGPETLILKLPALTTQGILEDTYDFVVIAKDLSHPEILRRQIFPDPESHRLASNTVLTTLVKSIQFRFLDKTETVVSPTSASSVEATLTLISKTGSVGSERSAVSQTTLRNAP